MGLHTQRPALRAASAYRVNLFLLQFQHPAMCVLPPQHTQHGELWSGRAGRYVGTTWQDGYTERLVQLGMGTH